MPGFFFIPSTLTRTAVRIGNILFVNYDDTEVFLKIVITIFSVCQFLLNLQAFDIIYFKIFR